MARGWELIKTDPWPHSGFSGDTNHTNAPQKPLGKEARLVREGSVRKKEQKTISLTLLNWETMGPFHKWEEMREAESPSEPHRKWRQSFLSTFGSFDFHSGDGAGLTSKTPPGIKPARLEPPLVFPNRAHIASPNKSPSQVWIKFGRQIGKRAP